MEIRRVKKKDWGVFQRDFSKAVGVVCIVTGVFLAGIIWGVPMTFAGGKLRTSMMADLINIDPAGMALSDRLIGQQVFEGLFEFDYTGEVPYKASPCLVESYQISPDAKMLILKLRKGVQFHHGYGELTSEDVVFNLKRHLDPKLASRARADLGDVERIEAMDKYTVKIYLKIPSARSLILNLAWQNAGFVISKKAFERLGDKTQTFPVGTGPYYFDKWAPGEKVVLKKFKDYWGVPARFDEIEFWIVPEEIVALGALEKGDLDVVSLSQPGTYERAKSIKDVRIEASTGNAYLYYFYTNHKKEPMNDLRVRRALAHALDLKGIAKRVGPLLEPWPSPLPPAVFAGTDEFWTYDYDLDKARKLLAEAGYPNGFELRMIYHQGYLYERVALEAVNCWKNVVDVKLEKVERAVYTKKINEEKHHIAVWGLTRFAPFAYAERYLTGVGRNYGRYSNPEVDEIVTKAKTAPTEKEARHWWREFQRKTTEDVAYYWPGMHVGIAAIRKNVKGVEILPMVPIFDFDNAYREE